MMADERDFELLDDYLSNRMPEEDYAAFRQKLEADPDLQHEYALQQQVIRGIQHARAAELKAMLNKVPVPPHNPGATLVSKVVLTAVVSLVIAGAAYWYFSPENVQPTTTTHVTTEEPLSAVEEPAAAETNQEAASTSDTETPEETENAQPDTRQPVTRSVPRADAGKNQTSAGTENSKPSLAKQPEPLQVPAPPARSNEAASSGDDLADATAEEPPLIIETHLQQAEYSFHYQLHGGKLSLFGPFGTGQYETVELLLNGSYAKFLYFNEAYYALEQTGVDILPLKQVTDPELLQKLADIRQAQ